MELTDKMIEEVEQFAATYLTDEEIGLVCGIDNIRERMRCDRELSNAITRGRLKTKSAINMSILEQAKRGSSPAQSLAKKMEIQLQIDSI
jgi:hypothetical protein